MLFFFIYAYKTYNNYFNFTVYTEHKRKPIIKHKVVKIKRKARTPVTFLLSYIWLSLPVELIYLIVAVKTDLFSRKFKFSLPYKSVSTFAALSRLLMSGVLEFEFKIELIVESKACLWMLKNGQNNKKCDVDSTPVPHGQILGCL